AFLSGLCVMLISLDSFYFYNQGMPLLSVLGALLSVFLIIFNKVKLHVYHIKIFKILFYILVVSLLIGIFNTQHFYIKRIPLFILVIPIAIYSGYLYNQQPKLLKKILVCIIA